MVSDAQRRATAKYKAKAVCQISVKFFPKDHDAYLFAKSKPKINQYIIELIRRDMDASK